MSGVGRSVLVCARRSPTAAAVKLSIEKYIGRSLFFVSGRDSQSQRRGREITQRSAMRTNRGARLERRNEDGEKKRRTEKGISEKMRRVTL